MTKQSVWDNSFIEVAKTLAKLSHCMSRKVCALAVKNNRIICTGINGTVKGALNCDDLFAYVDETNREQHHKWSLVNEVHAEANLVAEANKNGISLEGSTIYLTLSPCNTCCLLLASVGVKRIMYLEKYDKCDLQTGFNILKNLNIEVEQLTND